MKALALADYKALSHSDRSTLRRKAFGHPDPLPEHLEGVNVERLKAMLVAENEATGWFPSTWGSGPKATKGKTQAPAKVLKPKTLRGAAQLQAAYEAQDTDPQAALSLYHYCEHQAVWTVARAIGKALPGSVDLTNQTTLEESPEWVQVQTIAQRIVDSFLYGEKAAAKKAQSHFLNYWNTYLKNEIKDTKFTESLLCFANSEEEAPSKHRQRAFTPHPLSHAGNSEFAEVQPSEEFEEELLSDNDPARVYEELAATGEILSKLSKREREVLELLNYGDEYEEIRAKLGLSEAALKNIVYRLRNGVSQ